MKNNKNHYLVYMHTCVVNDKKYIGVTGQTLKRRIGRNWENYRGSPYFFSALQKYRSSNFKSEVLFEGLTKEEAAHKEKELIELYETLNPDKGFNLHRGGYRESELFSNDDRSDKISKTLKEQRSSESYRKVMADRMKKVWSDPERRAKMIQGRKGKSAGRYHKAKYRSFIWEDGSLIVNKDQNPIQSLHDLSNLFNLPHSYVLNKINKWLSSKHLSGMIVDDNVIFIKTTEDDNTWMLKKVNCWEVLEAPITNEGMDIGGWIISSRAAKSLKFRIKALAEGSTTIPKGSTLK
jgi:hypothetical protein